MTIEHMQEPLLFYLGDTEDYHAPLQFIGIVAVGRVCMGDLQKEVGIEGPSVEIRHSNPIDDLV